MVISENILNMLNEQFRHETANSLRYFQRANWAEAKGYVGSAAFYRQEAKGEQGHADKVLAFIDDRNAKAIIEPFAFDEPSMWPDLMDLFISALEVERGTTAKLTAIYQAAFAEGDIMTVNFMAEMIEAQRAEENEYSTILDRFVNYAPSASRNYDLDTWIKEQFVN